MSANTLEPAITAFQKGVAYEEKGNYVEAAKSYRTAAELNFADAQFALGHLYDEGAEGIAQDDNEAILWYRKAASQQHPEALFALGYMCQMGQGGMFKNEKMALEFYKNAALQGHVDAQFHLGRLYQLSKSSLQNNAEAVRYYALAAAQGHALARNSLQTMANMGHKAAIAAIKVLDERKLRSQPLESMEKPSHLTQGIHYMVDPKHFDYAKAYKHLKVAAKQEKNKRAYGYFGLLHEYGPTPAIDIALFFYAKADKQSVFIQLVEGVCYLRGFKNNPSNSGGEMAAQIFKHAITLNEKGIDANDLGMVAFIERVTQEKPQESADLILAIIYQIGLFGKEKDELKAAYFCNRALLKENVHLFYNMGKLYEKGDWPCKNILEAKRWYFLAADKGHTDARFILGVFYRDALVGGERNYEEALKWFLLAADEGGSRVAHDAIAAIYAKGAGSIQSNEVEADRRYQLGKTATRVPALEFKPLISSEPQPIPSTQTPLTQFFGLFRASSNSDNIPIITEGVPTVRALHNWKCKRDHQLSLEQGEVLYLLTDLGDWLHCERRNHEDGMVPRNFVEELPLANSLIVMPKDLPATALPISNDDIEYKRLLREGAFGAVYKGFWKQKELDVAVKKLRPGMDWNSEENTAVRDFKRELQVMLQLRHPNIVALCSYTTDTDIPYLVMEYMLGGSLWEKLGGREDKEVFLLWRTRFSFALNIAYGLKYLHEKKVLHRDLKSENVLLCEQGAKLADFGLSHMNTEAGTITLFSMESLGTPQWMAPELFVVPVRYNEKTDIYAYAMILWELMTHKKPYDGLSQSEIVKLVLDEGQRETIPPEFSETFKILVQQGWSQRSDERPTLPVMIESLKRGMKTERIDESMLLEEAESKRGISENKNGKDEVESAFAPSLKSGKEEVKVGPRTIPTFYLEDVSDNGNCFYHAVVSQMRITGRRRFLEGVPKETALHDSLRLLIQGADFRDREWADIAEIFSLVRHSNSIVAIIDTRYPQLGFRCYFSNADGGEQESSVYSEIPRDKHIIRLAFTGDHYLSVCSHPALERGGLLETFDARALFRSERTFSAGEGSSSSSTFPTRASRDSNKFFETQSTPRDSDPRTNTTCTPQNRG